jgi:DNA-binding GntR family transcriptional regulator
MPPKLARACGRSSGCGPLSKRWRSAWPSTHWFMLSRNVASSDWREETVKGHASLVEVIKAANEELAIEMIKEHISFARERILRSYLDSASGSAWAGG